MAMGMVREGQHQGQGEDTDRCRTTCTCKARGRYLRGSYWLIGLLGTWVPRVGNPGA